MENTTLNDDLYAARIAIRAHTTDPEQIWELANRLRRAGKYHYAGELYALMLKGGGDANDRKRWNKDLSFCIYKDPDQPFFVKFDTALHYLRQAISLETTQDAEFLGTAGSIYKRKWQHDNQFQNLVFAEHYYRKGYLSWQYRNGDRGEINEHAFEGSDDRGYTAINYAFVSELIAYIQFKEVGDLTNPEMSKSALERLNQSEKTRRYIIEKLLGPEFVQFPENPDRNLGSDNNKWEFATLAEAYFGINEYKGAQYFFKKYRETGPDRWEIHTTSEQLMRIAEIQSQNEEGVDVCLSNEHSYSESPEMKKNKIFAAARECLKVLNPGTEPPEDIAIAFRGKVGMAFSGGGCRASLYHVGVLARLAELDVLRHVEVISCVSGGSITGAYYYVLLKREMERHGEKMDQMHYISIVREMETTFLRAIQKNLRMRILLNPWKNLRMFFDKNYTRTHRLGELYEKHLYQEIIKNTHPEGRPILMHTLRIQPADIPAGESFNVKTDNWNRRNKVPILVLNATNLNSGHNWQFTASWMGEPPGNIKHDVDTKRRLRRMYYHEAPLPYKNNIRLGHAVGASSCVPVLFEPLMLKDLYPGIELQLIDGGVHDNQGVASLLEQECKMMILSDASGQMNDKATASGNAAEVFFQSDLVLQERVRESQLLDLKSRESTAQLVGMMFVHLKKELYQGSVNWKTCEEPQRTTISPNTPEKDPDLTKYGIRREVQQALAELRTDLDAFNDAEAYALMYSGYAQTTLEMRDKKFDYLKNDVSRQTWNFLDIEDRMRHVAPSENLLRRLRLGASLPLKPFKTSWFWSFVGITLGAALVLGTVYLIYALFWGKSFVFGLSQEFLRAVGWFVLGYLATLYLGSFVSKAMNWQNTLLKSVWLLAGAVMVAIVSWLYLLILNPVYLSYGKLTQLDREDRLKKWMQRIWEFFK